MRGPNAVVGERELRPIFKAQRAEPAGGDEIGVDPSITELDAVAAVVTLDLDHGLFVSITRDEFQSRPRRDSRRPAWRHRDSVSSGSRTFCDSSKAMMAAAMIAASRVASLAGRCWRSSSGRSRSRKLVSKLAVRKSGCCIRKVKNG